MKHLVYILLGLMLVGVFSCRRSPGGTEARLVAIDSLITAKPDSALSLLADINADSLPADLRAYHDVLTTQALYKAYIPATTDTLIARAWSYYRDHGPYDRRIRAMLYSGTTAEELGHPDSAMRWYKRTELESRPDDHYHRAYALRQMGIIYQNNIEHRNAINKYRIAVNDFKSISDTTNELFCLFQLSKMYHLVTPDSSEYYISILNQLSEVASDTLYIIAAKYSITGHYYYHHEFKKAKNIAVNTINRFIDFDTPLDLHLWYFAAYSYAKLGVFDSAYYYVNNAPSLPVDASDSVLYYETMRVINVENGNWEQAYINDSIENTVSDSRVDASIDKSKLHYESLTEKKWIEESKQKAHEKQMIVIIIVFVVAIVVMGSYFLYQLIQKKESNKKFNQLVNNVEELSRILSDSFQIYERPIDLEKLSLNQQIEYCNSIVDNYKELLKRLHNDNSLYRTSIIDVTRELSAYQIDMGNTITALEKQIFKLKRDLSKSEIDESKYLDAINKLEKEKAILLSNYNHVRDEVNDIQESIKPLSDIFRTILTAVRKQDGKQLDKTIKPLLTESFFKHIYQYVDYTHHHLFVEMKESDSLSKTEMDIVCLYLCHLPDTIIKIYADLTNTKSVNKLKKTIAKKITGNPNASLEMLRKY